MLMEEWIRDERKEAKEEGKAEGKAEGIAEAVMELLEDLGEVPDEVYDMIMEEENLEVLKSYNKKAAAADSIDEFMGMIQEEE